MMKAIKNFMNKPWTWGTYFKFCGVAMGLWIAIIGAWNFDDAAIARWTQKSMPDSIKNNIDISLYNSNITICIFRLLILNQQPELKSDIQNAKNTGCIETPISRNN